MSELDDSLQHFLAIRSNYERLHAQLLGKILTGSKSALLLSFTFNSPGFLIYSLGLVASSGGGPEKARPVVRALCKSAAFQEDLVG